MNFKFSTTGDLIKTEEFAISGFSHGTSMHYGKKASQGGGSVMLWAMFCWETLGPAIHVDVTLTRTTYLSIVTDHVHPLMETVFPDGCGLFQQDNAPCHKVKMVQEWFDEHNEFEVLTWPRIPQISSQQSICGMWRPHLTAFKTYRICC
ncbi:hypothetical protein QTP86_031044 [Hemibagrus guttatus]|nr:hypothetical protein QTP86_031044 [Hemibagrus guttatus]